MPWNPKYQSKFSGPIAEALLAFVQANAVEALKWANGGTALTYKRSDNSLAEGFAVYIAAPSFNTLFPAVEIFPVNTKTVEADDESHLNETHELMVSVECVASDPVEAQRRIQTYVRGVDSMLREASGKPILTADLAEGRFTRVVLSVTEHDYDPPQVGKNSLIQRSATLSVTARILET